MKRLKKYKEFLLEKINKPILKYMAFDWDDNILFMPTVIHMQQLVNDEWVNHDVTTDEFAKVRSLDNWRPARTLSDEDFENLSDEDVNEHLQMTAYSEFRDIGPRGSNAFSDDVNIAINNKKFGPSWKTFIECLSNGYIFTIITARGHEPDTMRNVVENIIWNILTEDERIEMGANLTGFQDMFIPNFDIMRSNSLKTLVSAYLDKCDFVGVSAPSFVKKYSSGGEFFDPSSPEKGKLLALDEFIERINTYGKQVDGEVRIGFSDDDVKTSKSIEKHFGEISSIYNEISFNVFDTSKNKMRKKEIS